MFALRAFHAVNVSVYCHIYTIALARSENDFFRFENKWARSLTLNRMMLRTVSCLYLFEFVMFGYLCSVTVSLNLLFSICNVMNVPSLLSPSQWKCACISSNANTMHISVNHNKHKQFDIEGAYVSIESLLRLRRFWLVKQRIRNWKSVESLFVNAMRTCFTTNQDDLLEW